MDDVGTVAVLHALADQGEVQILAMGLSGKNLWSPLCLDALNHYFGRPQIPIGIVKGELYNGLKDRQSWDQTAVLYAVRGLNGKRIGFWDTAPDGYMHVNEDGSNVWRVAPDKDHSYLVRK